MTPIERSYEWFKRLDAATQEGYRKNIDNALEHIRSTFKDRSITREQVEVILSTRDENLKERDLIIKSIDKLATEISEKTAEMDSLRTKLKLYNFVTYTEFDERNDRAIVMRKQEENRLAEIARKQAIKSAIEQQQRFIAEQTNLSVDEVNEVLNEAPKKKRKQAIKG